MNNIALLPFVLLATIFTLASVRADVFDKLRAKWLVSLTGTNYNPGDPAVGGRQCEQHFGNDNGTLRRRHECEVIGTAP